MPTDVNRLRPARPHMPVPRPVPILGPDCNHGEPWDDEEQRLIDDFDAQAVREQTLDFDPY
jgi:hypothetical protein